MNASNVGIKIIVCGECEERKSYRSELFFHFFVFLRKTFSSDQNSKLIYLTFWWDRALGCEGFFKSAVIINLLPLLRTRFSPGFAP